ncbi:AbrB family transcriptional regulator [Ectopseudomonas mendocina]|uniref:AbrB family transcriptional regulator n=1 Tax=Ectopseudomonas mendocina TaxID=300 RepID=A0ABZ2RLP9_ECTME
MQSISTPKQWMVLIIVSIGTSGVLILLSAPAAFMLGAMLAGIGVTARGWQLKLPTSLSNIAQAIIGCLIGSSITLNLLPHTANNLWLYSGITLSVLVISLGVGILVSRIQVLPGTTGIWGSLPGAAPMMIILSEQHGAAPHLVAFVQYTRVVMMAFVAALVVGAFAGNSSAPSSVSVPPLGGSGEPLGALLVVGGSLLIARLVPRASNIFLIAIVLGFALGSTELLSTHPPFWLQALGFVLLGWSIGLRFTREVRQAAVNAFFKVVALLAAMIALCLIPAAVLVLVFGIDPLTAYLASSPGGVDSIAIIASGSPVDMPFIITAQMFRFVIVLVFGPALTRFIARKFTLGPPSPLRPD